MTASTQKTLTVRTPSNQKAVKPAAAPKVEETQTKATMAKEPRPTHTGTVASTYRIGKKLTPLRTDYRAGDMTQKDNEFLREVIALAGKMGTFERRNIDAGRLGRLFTQGFVTYDEIGVVDPAQPISITDKAKEFVKPVKAA